MFNNISYLPKALLHFELGLKTLNKFLLKSSISAIGVKRQLNSIWAQHPIFDRTATGREYIDTGPVTGYLLEINTAFQGSNTFQFRWQA